MATVTESEKVNYPNIRYFRNVQKFGHPSQNTDTLTREIFDNQYQNFVTKDISKRDWQAMIAAGRNATTPLSGAELKRHFVPGYYYKSWHRVANDAFGFKPHYSQTLYLDLAGTNNSPPTAHNAGSSFSEADSAAKIKFVSRANQQMQSFKGMQYLAEADDSIRMLRNNAKQMADRTNRYLDEVQKDFRGSKKRLYKLPKRVKRLGRYIDQLQRVVQQRYLEYTYGINPLMRDTREAAETLSKIHNFDDHHDRRMISAVSHARGPLSYGTAGFLRGSLNANSVVTTYTNCSVTYRGVVATTMSSLAEVNKFVGFDPSDFFPTVWEWLPWSMVADYFTNISEIIDAASFKRSSLNWVARTVVYETIRSDSNWVVNSGSGMSAGVTVLDDEVFTPSRTVWNLRTVDRSTYAGNLIPDFTWNLPGNKQTLNILALVAGFKRSQQFIHNFLT